MEADNRWGSFPPSSLKQLLLTLEVRQSVAQGAAVISLFDGRHDSSDLTFDRFELQPISPELLLALGRHTVGLPERFRLQGGVVYTPADKTSSQLFLEALPLINAGSVGLLDHRRLLDQLIGLERRTSFGTGRDTVGHPPGAHDDVAVAACGSILMATAKQPQTRVGAIDPEGRIYWHGEEPRDHSRITWITVDKDGNEVKKETKNGRLSV